MPATEATVQPAVLQRDGVRRSVPFLPAWCSVDTYKLLTAPGTVPKQMIFLVPALKRWSDVTLLDRFLRMANVMVKEIMTPSEIFGRQSSPPGGAAPALSFHLHAVVQPADRKYPR